MMTRPRKAKDQESKLENELKLESDLLAELATQADQADKQHATSEQDLEARELAWWRREARKSELEDRETDRDRARSDMRLREVFANRAFDLAAMGVWLWACFLMAHGVVFITIDKPLYSDKVLVAITAGATVNVFAAFIGVIRGLFPADAYRRLARSSDEERKLVKQAQRRGQRRR